MNLLEILLIINAVLLVSGIVLVTLAIRNQIALEKVIVTTSTHTIDAVVNAVGKWMMQISIFESKLDNLEKRFDIIGAKINNLEHSQALLRDELIIMKERLLKIIKAEIQRDKPPNGIRE